MSLPCGKRRKMKEREFDSFLKLLNRAELHEYMQIVGRQWIALFATS